MDGDNQCYDIPFHRCEGKIANCWQPFTPSWTWTMPMTKMTVFCLQVPETNCQQITWGLLVQSHMFALSSEVSRQHFARNQFTVIECAFISTSRFITPLHFERSKDRHSKLTFMYLFTAARIFGYQVVFTLWRICSLSNASIPHSSTGNIVLSSVNSKHQNATGCFLNSKHKTVQEKKFTWCVLPEKPVC